MLSWEMLKKKGGEEGKMCKSAKASSAATFLYNSSLFRREKMAVAVMWKGTQKGRREQKCEASSLGKGVRLKDSQFVFDKFLLLNKQVLSVKLRDYLRLGCKNPQKGETTFGCRSVQLSAPSDS